jgi:hypothetical protein
LKSRDLGFLSSCVRRLQATIDRLFELQKAQQAEIDAQQVWQTAQFLS